MGLIYRPSESAFLLHRDRVFGDKVHESRPLIFHATAGEHTEQGGLLGLLASLAGGETGPRNEMEHGGVDLVDCEVWTKDYIDKWSHFPYDTWPKTPHSWARTS